MRTHSRRVSRSLDAIEFEFVDFASRAAHRQIIMLNEEECTDEQVQGMLSIMTFFCARLYSRRLARNRPKKTVEATKTRRICYI